MPEGGHSRTLGDRRRISNASGHATAGPSTDRNAATVMVVENATEQDVMNAQAVLDGVRERSVAVESMYCIRTRLGAIHAVEIRPSGMLELVSTTSRANDTLSMWQGV